MRGLQGLVASAIAFGVCASAVGSAAAVPFAAGRTSGVSFVALPAQVFQGQRVSFKVLVGPASKTCTLAIHYKGGNIQRLAPVSAASGTASWTVRIPSAPPGTATLKASCPAAGTATAKLAIKWALQAPKLVVTRRGFSQRMHAYDPGSDVNFGLAVRNDRSHFDATGISILVNIVDATNRVLGSAHLSESRIPAATLIYLGGQMGIPTQTPVARIEVVFVSATSSEVQPATPLLISDVILTAGTDSYVSTLRGQLLNTYRQPLQSGEVGVLFEDVAGNVIGGGVGGAPGPVSLGAREAFDISGGFNAIPFSQVAKTLIKIVPTYAQPPH